MVRLAIVSSHPIQYNAPWFKLLSQRDKLQVKIFYTWDSINLGGKYDPGFGKKIEWDVPLLNGYDYCFVDNISKDPGSHHYRGIDNPLLIQNIAEWQATALLVIGWSYKSHLKCIRHFKGKIPVLFRGDSTLLDEQKGLKQILRRVFLTWVYKHIDYALYVGTNNKRYYEAHGLKPKQLVHVPHAVDNNRFALNAVQQQQTAIEWRTQMQIPQHAFVFLFAGKLESKKNPELLIEAFESLENKELHLVIVGNGELEGVLKSKFGTIKNLHFIPFKNQSQMPAVYMMCNAFVLPSQGPGETWGLSINEAMSCKKPVIASSKCGGAVDLIDEGRNGYIFESGDISDLILKMKQLVMLGQNLPAFGNYSFIKIQKFSFEKLCDQVELLLTQKI